MKSLIVFYMNKYPGGSVHCSESRLDVWDAAGAHRVSVAINGGGALSDQSESLGLPDRHDMAPIPKIARLFKDCPKRGFIVQDEKAEQRKSAMSKHADFMDGLRVMSCDEIERKSDGKIKFDKSQELAD